jgi:hypothetical protein
MRELAIAGVWLIVAVGLFAIQSDVRVEYLPYVVRGQWVALLLAGMNALRPVVKIYGLWLCRQFGWFRPPPEPARESPPVKPIVHPEFRIADDGIQNTTPESFKA